MKKHIQKILPHDAFLRLAYHACTGWLAAMIYGFPARDMTCIGITGTDGKTTTTFLTTDLLRRQGIRVGMTSTVGFRIGDDYWPNKTHKTTMGRFALQKMLREMVRNGCTHAVIEVSSHGLMQSRVAGIPFSIAVITNLSREHLDYHGTMEKYKKAKGKLFKIAARQKESTSIVYADFPASEYFQSFATKDHLVYGFSDGEATGKEGALTATIKEVGELGQTMVLQEDANTYTVQTQLSGDFNVLNILAALQVGRSLGLPLDQLLHAVPHLKSVPGRMEEVRTASGKRVIIDYAVTPDALQKLYQTLRSMTDGKVIAVLGACGDRDQGKRAEMGKIATELTDYVFFTDEEPYTEDPETIIDMLVKGAESVGAQNYQREPSRRQAIGDAIRMATPKDLVVVSGMGDQTSRIVGGKKESWSDRYEIEAVME